MNIIFAIFVGYILRIFVELYITKSKFPELCKTCEFPKECKAEGKCKYYKPELKENSDND